MVWTPQAGGKASKYDVATRPTGFVVSGKDRGTVEVEMNGTSFVITGDGGYPADDFGWSVGGSETIGLCCFYSLNSAIANRLMSAWEPPKDKPDRGWVKTWARKQTERAINSRVHEQWTRLLTNADQSAIKVQKSLFAATMTCPSIAHSPELYKNRFVVSDIINYRGAAIAAANVDTLAEPYVKNFIKKSPEFKKILGLARGLGFDVCVSQDSTTASPNAAQRQEREIDILTDWQSLFSITGCKYRTLSRTLMQLPGGIPHKLIRWLVNIHLPRPVTDRLELLAILGYLKAVGSTRRDSTDNLPVFSHARRPQIKAAMERVGRFNHEQLSHRKTRDVLSFVQFLVDCPHGHNGNIVGLAEKSIRWHRDEQEKVRQETIAMYGSRRETARPPIALPTHAGVRFLSRVQDVCDEGRDMNHCISSLAGDAVSGYCYLFHVDYRGEAASVQVDASGSVAQSQGPRNSKNKASRFARRVLNQWGAKLPKHESYSMPF